jgi:hypothetical protein
MNHEEHQEQTDEREDIYQRYSQHREAEEAEEIRQGNPLPDRMTADISESRESVYSRYHEDQEKKEFKQKEAERNRRMELLHKYGPKPQTSQELIDTIEEAHKECEAEGVPGLRENIPAIQAELVKIYQADPQNYDWKHWDCKDGWKQIWHEKYPEIYHSIVPIEDEETTE